VLGRDPGALGAPRLRRDDLPRIVVRDHGLDAARCVVEGAILSSPDPPADPPVRELTHDHTGDNRQDEQRKPDHGVPIETQAVASKTHIARRMVIRAWNAGYAVKILNRYLVTTSGNGCPDNRGSTLVILAPRTQTPLDPCSDAALLLVDSPL
jgi:hypothetical protein